VIDVRRSVDTVLEPMMASCTIASLVHTNASMDDTITPAFDAAVSGVTQTLITDP
jgi:hypothetical protein